MTAAVTAPIHGTQIQSLTLPLCVTRRRNQPSSRLCWRNLYKTTAPFRIWQYLRKCLAKRRLSTFRNVLLPQWQHRQQNRWCHQYLLQCDWQKNPSNNEVWNKKYARHSHCRGAPNCCSQLMPQESLDMAVKRDPWKAFATVLWRQRRRWRLHNVYRLCHRCLRTSTLLDRFRVLHLHLPHYWRCSWNFILTSGSMCPWYGGTPITSIHIMLSAWNSLQWTPLPEIDVTNPTLFVGITPHTSPHDFLTLSPNVLHMTALNLPDPSPCRPEHKYHHSNYLVSANDSCGPVLLLETALKSQTPIQASGGSVWPHRCPYVPFNLAHFTVSSRLPQRHRRQSLQRRPTLKSSSSPKTSTTVSVRVTSLSMATSIATATAHSNPDSWAWLHAGARPVIAKTRQQPPRQYLEPWRFPKIAGF